MPGAAAVGAPGRAGGIPPGAVAVGGTGLPPGKGPAPAGGAGGPPLVPGTGSVLAWGNLVCGASAGAVCGAMGGVAVGATAVGVVGGAPGLAIGRIIALGGIGALPCWISAARCTTACGMAGPAGLARPSIAGARLPGPAAPAPAAGAGAGGRLITVLMTVVLCMFWKMMLFGGGAT